MVIATASEYSSTANAGSFRYGWLRTLMLLVSAALAWIVVHIHLDISSSTRSRASLPFAMNVSSAVAAERNYAIGRMEQAAAIAIIALKQSPLSTRALRTLALSAQESGRTELSGRAMGLAGALGWRDTPTQLWLIQAFWMQGNYVAALERADALARRNQLPDKMRAVFISAALNPSSRSAVVDRLSTKPSWRLQFFEGAHFLPRSQITEYAKFLEFLVSRGETLTMSEAEPFAATLYANRFYRRGWLHWQSIVGQRQSRAIDVFDGDFEVSTLDPQRHVSLFEWRFPQSAGASASFGIPPNRSNDRSLHAVSEGNARVVIATQTLALKPDQYIIKVQAFSNHRADARSSSWEIYCVEGPRLITMPAQVAPSSDHWMLLSQQFDIPQQDCEAQQLKIVLNGNKSQPIDIWFDKVALIAE